MKHYRIILLTLMAVLAQPVFAHENESEKTMKPMDHGKMKGMDHDKMKGEHHEKMKARMKEMMDRCGMSDEDRDEMKSMMKEMMDHDGKKDMDRDRMKARMKEMMAGCKTEDMDHGKMKGMDHDGMKGMDHGKMKGMDHDGMEGMDHGKMGGMDHDSMPHSHGGQGEHHGNSAGTPVPPAPFVDQTIRVTLHDSMQIKYSEPVNIKAGNVVKFVVTNQGKVRHEFSISNAEEQKEHVAMMRAMPNMKHDDGTTISLESGETGELFWKFDGERDVVFSCNIPGHSEAGMLTHVTLN